MSQARASLSLYAKIDPRCTPRMHSGAPVTPQREVAAKCNNSYGNRAPRMEAHYFRECTRTDCSDPSLSVAERVRWVERDKIKRLATIVGIDTHRSSSAFPSEFLCISVCFSRSNAARRGTRAINAPATWRNYSYWLYCYLPRPPPCIFANICDNAATLTSGFS